MIKLSLHHILPLSYGSFVVHDDLHDLGRVRDEVCIVGDASEDDETDQGDYKPEVDEFHERVELLTLGGSHERDVHPRLKFQFSSKSLELVVEIHKSEHGGQFGLLAHEAEQDPIP